MIKPWSISSYVCWLSLVFVIVVIFVVLGSIKLKKYNDDRKIGITLQSVDKKFNQKFTLTRHQKYFTLNDASGKVFEVNSFKKFQTDDKGLLMTANNNYVNVDSRRNFQINGDGSKLVILL